MSDVDGLPYSTILYGSGPGHSTRNVDGENVEEVEVQQTAIPDMNRVHAAAAPRQWATHGAEDVPVYAMGGLPSFMPFFSEIKFHVSVLFRREQ